MSKISTRCSTRSARRRAATSSSARSMTDAVITLREHAASQAEAERLARELAPARASAAPRRRRVSDEPAAPRFAQARRARARRAPRQAAARAATQARSPGAAASASSRARRCRARRRVPHRWVRRRDRLSAGLLALVAGAVLDRREHVHLRRRRLAPRRRSLRGKEPAEGSAGTRSARGSSRRRSRSRTSATGSTAGSTRSASRAPSGRTCSAGQGRAGRLDDHAAARAQPLHLARAHLHAQAARGVPRGEARRQVVEAEDPDGVPEPDLLRQPGVRRRGRVADVLLEAGEEADARTGGAARRPAAGALELRPVRESRARRARGAKQVLRAMLGTGAITRRQYRTRGRETTACT